MKPTHWSFQGQTLTQRGTQVQGNRQDPEQEVVSPFPSTNQNTLFPSLERGQKVTLARGSWGGPRGPGGAEATGATHGVFGAVAFYQQVRMV